MVSTNFEQSLTNCTSNYTKNTVPVGDPVTITLTGTNGATFEDDVQIGYTEHGAWTTEQRIPASHENTLSLTWTPSENVNYTLMASAKVPVTIDVVLKLTNCSLDQTYTKVNESTPQTWIATPATGYKFDSTTKPTITYDGDWGGGSVDSTSTLNGNGTLSISFTSPSSDETSATSITVTLSAIKGAVEPQPTPPTETVPAYKFDDEFLRYGVSVTELTSSTFPSNLKQIHLTSNGKFLTDCGIFYVNKNNELKLIAKIPKTNTGTAISDTFDITSLPDITTIPNTIIYVFADSYSNGLPTPSKSKFDVTNADVYINDTKITNGDTTPYGLVHVKLQALDSCIFDKTGSFFISDSLGDGKNFSLVPNNNNVLEYDYYIGFNSWFNVNINATKKTLIDTGGYVNIYDTNTKEITALSKEIIANNSGSSPTLLDSASYIKAYYRIPFKIDDSNLQTGVNFLLANTKSTTTTTQVTSDTLTFAIGKINVPEKYKNAFDYQNVSCVLYLPFADSIELSPADVINKTIAINYVMDMYTGIVTINVMNSDNDTIYSKAFKLSTDLPFLQVVNLAQTGKIVNTYNNAIRQAYVLLTRHVPVTQQFGYPTREQGPLKYYKGYVECSDIQLNSLSDNEELSEIQALLSKGVFIK